MIWYHTSPPTLWDYFIDLTKIFKSFELYIICIFHGWGNTCSTFLSHFGPWSTPQGPLHQHNDYFSHTVSLSLKACDIKVPIGSGHFDPYKLLRRTRLYNPSQSNIPQQYTSTLKNSSVFSVKTMTTYILNNLMELLSIA